MFWLAAGGLAAWLAVLLLPSRPWSTRERLQPDSADPVDPGLVTALIPARNEAAAIASTLAALAQQGPGLKLVLIDDESDDGTAEVAVEANRQLDQPLDLTVIAGQPLAAGWSGKLWALSQGLPAVKTRFTLLIDAEIELAPGMLAALLDKARREQRGLVSIMARLRCEGFWEKLLVPAFVYFFKLLYPFARVSSPRHATAAAAGGCILVRTEALHRIGGFAAIHDALIDDCTLARRIKQAGFPIWLGLSDAVSSSRPYPDLAGFRRMVTRTAFTQLYYSWLLLLLVTAIMLLMFVAPVLLLLGGAGAEMRFLGAAALLAMSASYWPVVRFYGLSPWWVFSLPLAGALYLTMTIESALAHARGTTARWKGRHYSS